MHPFDIRKFKEKWPDLNLIEPMELRAFLSLCRSGSDLDREVALNLLLNPEEAELPSYYLRLASFMADFRIRAGEMPEPLLHLFCESIAFAEKISAVLTISDDSWSFEYLLAKVPAKLLRGLFEKRYPLRPFLEHIPTNRLFSGRASNSRILRKRWRILRKNLLAQACPHEVGHSLAKGSSTSLPDPALEITLADLHFLSDARKRPGQVQNVWRLHGKAVLACGRGAPKGAAPPAEPIRSAYWRGAGNRTLAFWENLVDAQAGELAAVRNLAREASRRTGRVVHSWHNASLAAVGGWAFEPLSAQFPSPDLYDRFARDVLQDVSRIRKSFDFTAANNLFAMRAERLFDPKTEDGVRRTDFNKSSGEGQMTYSLSSTLRYPKSVRSPSSVREWSGALSPHQQVTPEQVLAWRDGQEKGWADGLTLLLALASRGQEMLDSGKLSSLVLPWIDKFFISSRRKADQGYLSALFRFIGPYLENPLILFWEDTAHSQLPSLGLTLEDLSQQGLPFRGIGIFDHGTSLRSDALEIIVRSYPEESLFVLRPLNDNHCPDAFRRIFRDLDFHFFRAYDSSWKDNLVFIYSGTQVFPLLSIQTEMETICPWVCFGKRRYPFGAWFRQRLRTNVPGAGNTLRDPLFHEYASWANLL